MAKGRRGPRRWYKTTSLPRAVHRPLATRSLHVAFSTTCIRSHAPSCRTAARVTTKTNIGGQTHPSFAILDCSTCRWYSILFVSPSPSPSPTPCLPSPLSIPAAGLLVGFSLNAGIGADVFTSRAERTLDAIVWVGLRARRCDGRRLVWVWVWVWV